MKTSLAAGVLAAASLASTPSVPAVRAADIAITGTRLLVQEGGVDEPALLFVARNDAAIEKGPGSPDPRTDLPGLTARLEIFYTATPEVVLGVWNLPAPWQYNRDRGARFINRAAPDGPTTVRTAAIRRGRSVRVRARGLGDEATIDLPADLPSTDRGLTVALTVHNAHDGSTHRMCTRFAEAAGSVVRLTEGPRKGQRLIARHGAAAPCPPCAVASDCRLWEAGQVAGVRVGLAGGHQPARANELVLAESNLTSNHCFSWNRMWPEPDRWDFACADQRYARAEDNGLHQAGFHFAWEQVFLDDLPSWVLEIDDPDELRAILRERARVIFERYPALDRINVINEPLSTLGASGAVEENYFYQVLGPDYIAELFHIVDAEASEDVELVLNENFVEYFPAKADGLVNLVRELVSGGAPIDSVGFQGHLMLTELLGREPDFALLQATMQQVADLGVDVWISELDNPVDPAREDRFVYQADNFRKVVEACLAVSRCTDILIWGVQDQASFWFPLPYSDPAPLLFDMNFEPKLAYFAVRSTLLKGRP